MLNHYPSIKQTLLRPLYLIFVQKVTKVYVSTWEDIENRIFNPWESERIVIDTAHKSIEESQNELDTKIHSFCTANGIDLCVNKC